MNSRIAAVVWALLAVACLGIAAMVATTAMQTNAQMDAFAVRAGFETVRTLRKMASAGAMGCAGISALYLIASLWRRH